MDIYGLAFQAMHRETGKKNKAQARDRAIAFENSFLVFIMQWALLAIVLHIMLGQHNF
jgi:cytochrome oxidase assembly protein ShyY1